MFIYRASKGETTVIGYYLTLDRAKAACETSADQDFAPGENFVDWSENPDLPGEAWYFIPQEFDGTVYEVTKIEVTEE